MKLLKKVGLIEVERAFVISDFISQQKNAKGARSETSPALYRKQLAHAKKIVLELPDKMLGLVVRGTSKTRYKLYTKLDWHIGIVTIDEVGVWKKAGGLPLAWTRGSLRETSDHVRKSLTNKKRISKGRAQNAVPGILKTSLPFIQKEKYQLPIVVPGGAMCRKGLPKMKGEIDDGCMRSIALAVSGKEDIKVYIGKKK